MKCMSDRRGKSERQRVPSSPAARRRSQLCIRRDCLLNAWVWKNGSKSRRYILIHFVNSWEFHQCWSLHLEAIFHKCLSFLLVIGCTLRPVWIAVCPTVGGSITPKGKDKFQITYWKIRHHMWQQWKVEQNQLKPKKNILAAKVHYVKFIFVRNAALGLGI